MTYPFPDPNPLPGPKPGKKLYALGFAIGFLIVLSGCNPEEQAGEPKCVKSVAQGTVGQPQPIPTPCPETWGDGQ